MPVPNQFEATSEQMVRTGFSTRRIRPRGFVRLSRIRGGLAWQDES